MSSTIKCRMMMLDYDQEATIRAFLYSCGLTFSHDLDKQEFIFELKHLPEILVRLEGAGVFAGESREWDLIALSEQGIGLYVCNAAGDGYILIPRENIISMHCVDVGMLQAARKYAEKKAN